MAEDVQGTPATPGGSGGANALSPGERVGASRYTLLRQLGQGGMGMVWLAQDEQLGEEVALKFLAREISHDADSLEELRRETLKSRKLTHSHIIRIHDLHQAPGEAPFISMEYVNGQTLSALKAQQPSRLFAWDFLQPLVRQLCDALEYAHRHKVIHRDLKPANMMVNSDGELRLADFGIAAVASESMSRLSQQRNTSGTPAYMSPQQMDGRPPRITDDIYALGATLYELLTSKPPFYHGNILHQVMNVPADPLDARLAELELSNAIPPDVAALIMACLAKDPAQRPQSVGAVAEWIGLTLGTQPTGQILASAGTVQPQVEKGAGAVAEEVEQEEEAELEEAPAARAGSKTGLWIGLSLVAVMLVAFMGWRILRKPGQITPPATPTGVATWITLDISAACNADVISTAARKAADQLTFNGGTLASASWLRMKSYPQPGVPDDGRIPIPDTTPPGFFQVRVPPGRNAMLLSSPQGRFPQPVTVELTASDRRRFSELAILHATCWGNGTLRVLLHYETGDDTTVSIPLCDWFADGRTSLPAGLRVAVTSHDTHPTGGKPAEILAQRIPADPQRTLRSLTFSFGSLTPPKGYAEQDARSRFTIGIFAVGALPAAAGTSATADVAWQNAINLLPLIDPPKDAIMGTWRRQGDDLATDGARYGRLELPYQPPAEYDFRIEFTPQGGTIRNEVIQLLTAEGRPFAWKMGAYGNPATVFCFHTVSQRAPVQVTAGTNLVARPITVVAPAGPLALPVAVEGSLNHGQRYTSLVEVRRDGFAAFVDGKLILRCQTDYQQVSLESNWSLHDPTRLGVAVQDRPVLFHRIEVREVTGKGRVTRAAPSASAAPVPSHQSRLTPAANAFLREVAALPAEQQVARVVAKLKELSPNFDPVKTKVEHQIVNGRVVELTVREGNVGDISPIRALTDLQRLNCYANPLEHLSSMRGLALTTLRFNGCRVSDLSPLRGMPLTVLDVSLSPVTNLSPLQGMKLTRLSLYSTPVSDLTPLRGMPLSDLNCASSQVSDLSPLKGMPLNQLICYSTKVADLTPLKGMPLTTLIMYRTSVTDLSPIEGSPLKIFWCEEAVAANPRNQKVLRSIKTLASINDLPAAEFWRKLGTGAVPKP